MIPIHEVQEKSKVIYDNRSQMKFVCGEREQRLAGQGHKGSLLGDRNILYLDLGGHNTGVHIYKNPINCTLKI